MRGHIKETGTFLLALVLIAAFTSVPVFAAELICKDASPGNCNLDYVENLAEEKVIAGEAGGDFKLSAAVNRAKPARVLALAQFFFNKQKAQLNKIRSLAQEFFDAQKVYLAKMLTFNKASVAVQKAEASHDMEDIAEAQNLIIDLPEQKERDVLNARVHRLLSGDLPDIYGEDFTSDTPTPELWALIDRVGVTPEMIAADEDEGKAAHGMWGYQDNLGSGQYDFLTVDFYTSSQPGDTYWSFFQWSMDMDEYKRIKGYEDIEDMDGYGGLQVLSGGETTAITSMWQSEADNGDILTPTCIYPSDKASAFDHEGSGTGLVIDHDWEANHWYRFVVRSFADEKAATTYVASYVMDLETEEVTLIAVYDTHLPQSFMYNYGQFLENFDEVSYVYHRDMYMKNFYAHDVHSQKWYSLNTGILMIGDLGNPQGTYRFSAGNGILRVEICGIGENAVENDDYGSTVWSYNLSQPKTPDINKALFPIP